MPKPVNTILQQKFGERVRKHREDQALSLADLASRCDVDKSNISKIENGRFNVQLTKIFELAKGLGISPSELLDFE